MTQNKLIEKAAIAIKNAEALFITTGAGMGVDSGLPDFRGNEGFWNAYPPIAKLGISFVEMANPAWFRQKPNLAWAFYGHRLNLYRKTTPHEGYQTLLKWASQKNGNYFAFTSNVDGHFQKAGFDSGRVEECHGSINHLQCVENCSTDIWPAKDLKVEVDEGSFLAMDPLPKCNNCGGLARPNILMFGDWNWIADRSNQQERRKRRWMQEMQTQGRNIIIIELGAGIAVPTVRNESEYAVHASGASLIRINPRDSYVPGGQLALSMTALEAVQMIDGIMA